MICPRCGNTIDPDEERTWAANECDDCCADLEDGEPYDVDDVTDTECDGCDFGCCACSPLVECSGCDACEVVP